MIRNICPVSYAASCISSLGPIEVLFGCMGVVSIQLILVCRVKKPGSLLVYAVTAE